MEIKFNYYNSCKIYRLTKKMTKNPRRKRERERENKYIQFKVIKKSCCNKKEKIKQVKKKMCRISTLTTTKNAEVYDEIKISNF